MPDIATGLSALKSAFDIAKEMKNASAAYNDAEMRLKFTELYSALSEARIELADTQIEIHSLRQKIKELQDKIELSDDVVFRDGYYYRVTHIDGKPDGPFCPNCFEGAGRKLSTMKGSGPFAHFGKYKCNSCAKYF